MKSVDTLPKTTFSGRRFTRQQLAQVQQTVQRFPQLTRTELARTVCENLNWKTPNGQDKVESCLTLLEALEAHGIVTLPAKQSRRAAQRRAPRVEEVPWAPAIEAPLSAVMPIRLEAVGSSGEVRERFKAYLERYHYLGYRQPVGAHRGYFIVSEACQERLGCLLFSASAAWALAPRDAWIGWQEPHRKKLLPLILSNDRFLIFPWVQVPHLASHALSLATRQIGDDWLESFGYRPVLIETFVDPTRFTGTCYRAANWQCLGHTQGRGRLAPDHQRRLSQKEIFVYPLQSDWRQRLTSVPRAAELKKRYRNEIKASRSPAIDAPFLALWEHVVHIFRDVAAEYDRQWRVRKRLVDTLMLMLLIFRLVCSKNTQSYGTTIDEFWDNCRQLKWPLPQQASIAPSSFCAARRKLDEAVFKCAHHKILAAYADDAGRYTWRGHRLFAIDGSKINLPRALLACGYATPTPGAHYPQGLVSCLYQLKSQLPFDFDLVAHADERRCALSHLNVLEPGDVVVYDRGYFSYRLLFEHLETGIHAIFRLHEGSAEAIAGFMAGSQTQAKVTINPSSKARVELRSHDPDLQLGLLPLRVLKYEVGGKLFCLGTTLPEAQRYPLDALVNVYHSRWGIEELYKISKRHFVIEDFHAKTERGVKQELFAHFVLITLNRLFTNRADLELNPRQPSASAPEKDAPKLKTNFKNAIHVLERGLEELLLLHHRIKGVVRRVFLTVLARHQRVRPNRSYVRRSMRPHTKWALTKEKRQAQKAAAATFA
jgi:hypothetical protein